MFENQVLGHGSLLADAMGLGKSAQLVRMLCKCWEHPKLRKTVFPVVLLCQKSLLFHWKNEFQKWGFLGSYDVLHGSNPSALPNAFDLDVKITTAHGWSEAPEFHRVENCRGLVIDEVTLIKNADANVSRLVHACAPHLALRIGLSGTPSPNDPSEFASIMDFIQPDLLGGADVFDTTFGSPIRAGTRTRSNPVQIAMATAQARMLYDIVKPYMLRRIHELHHRIPKRDDVVMWADLAPSQRVLYDEIASQAKRKRKGRFAHDHELFAVVGGSHPRMAGMPVGKLGLLCSMVRRLLRSDKDSRVAIFFHFKFLIKRFKEAFPEALIITGDTGARLRQQHIDTINDPGSAARVICLTSRSSAMGVNFHLVDHIVLGELDYNGSIDTQAGARASRLENKKEVTCYRIVTRGTIEEHVHQVAMNKEIQTRLILNDHSLDGREVSAAQAVVAVGDATSLFGDLVSVSSQSEQVKRFEVHFKQDREQAKKRWEIRKSRAAAKATKVSALKKVLRRLTAQLRKWVGGGKRRVDGGVSTARIMTKFAPLVKKHRILPADFRRCLQRAAVFRKDTRLWVAQSGGTFG
jgi:SNF2 family DNA or RNA helicase